MGGHLPVEGRRCHRRSARSPSSPSSASPVKGSRRCCSSSAPTPAAPRAAEVVSRRPARPRRQRDHRCAHLRRRRAHRPAQVLPLHRRRAHPLRRRAGRQGRPRVPRVARVRARLADRPHVVDRLRTPRIRIDARLPQGPLRLVADPRAHPRVHLPRVRDPCTVAVPATCPRRWHRRCRVDQSSTTRCSRSTSPATPDPVRRHTSARDTTPPCRLPD